MGGIGLICWTDGISCACWRAIGFPGEGTPGRGRAGNDGEAGKMRCPVGFCVLLLFLGAAIVNLPRGTVNFSQPEAALIDLSPNSRSQLTILRLFQSRPGADAVSYEVRMPGLLFPIPER